MLQGLLTYPREENINLVRKTPDHYGQNIFFLVTTAFFSGGCGGLAGGQDSHTGRQNAESSMFPISRRRER